MHNELDAFAYGIAAMIIIPLVIALIRVCI